MNSLINLICIIDDDPICIFAMKKLLKRNNFPEKYLIYKNGKEAIEAIEYKKKKLKQLPDIILLDINMPIMDGWQFLNVYEELNFGNLIPIHIMSSSIDEKDLDKAKNNALVKSYINKPFDSNSLKVIKELI